ncbi:hypothetical protein JIN85_02895 [Luteolibacter pohnpeiensis]|uniref:Rhamnogalacturonase A/B/Epimerase-like pectate lyase domain-containing protein n=1 Tax=Luteolibacter pohnpeiensis TaxID=454153 RepID=A0A934VUP2_9BACT|nr:glycosyl hydrolase family 28-related protein [Luteolibacter pohnpeiensis]MBK1881345.1 hypothetical protein [Luteolibacter pohnpeiensis]
MTVSTRLCMLLSIALIWTFSSRIANSQTETSQHAPPGTYVLNLAALRSIDSKSLENGQPIFVTHHSVSNDPGGGIFVWEAELNYKWPPEPDDPSVYPNSRAGDNNGTIIRPDDVSADQPGRWVRQAYLDQGSKMVNVNWFGARPDLPDFDNAPAIQAAHDTLPIMTFNVGPAPSGRHIRPGTVQLGAGTYWIGTTLYQSSRTTLTGKGMQTSTLAAMVGRFDDPTPGAETWMVRWEKPPEVTPNNNFYCRLENLGVIGSAALNNHENRSVSGVQIQGAQGSWMRDVSFHSFAKRGTDCQVSILGTCWFADVREGPVVDLAGGPGYQFGNLSIEHGNPTGKFMDPETKLPIAALRIRNMDVASFEQVQFEGSQVACSMVNCRGLTFNAVVNNRSGLQDSYTFYIQGDSYSNQFLKKFFYLGGKTDDFQIYDNSLIAIRDQKSGEIYQKVITK